MALKKKPESIQIKTSKYGKPFVEGSFLKFNLTHSKDLFACVISNDNNIGIDIEYINRDIDWQDLSKKAFTKKERMLINKSKDNIMEFFRFWTRKEAYFKCIGERMNKNLSNTHTSKEKGSKIDITTINLTDNYVCSVAIISKL